jgi:3-hydroxyisobutyrate dehydrogenase-like beta-hydroxyacid dehydrogenase
VQVGKLGSAKRHDYTPQFAIRLTQKDFGLAFSAARRANLSLPATEAAAGVNATETANGGEDDFSAVVRWMEQQVVAERSLPSAA